MAALGMLVDKEAGPREVSWNAARKILWGLLHDAVTGFKKHFRVAFVFGIFTFEWDREISKLMKKKSVVNEGSTEGNMGLWELQGGI